MPKLHVCGWFDALGPPTGVITFPALAPGKYVFHYVVGGDCNAVVASSYPVLVRPVADGPGNGLTAAGTCENEAFSCISLKRVRVCD